MDTRFPTEDQGVMIRRKIDAEKDNNPYLLLVGWWNMPSEMYEPRAVRIQRGRCHLQLKTSRKDACRLGLEGWPEFECWIWGNGEERAFWTQGAMWAETWRQAQRRAGTEAGGGKGFECQTKECGLNLGDIHGCSGAEAGSSDLSCWELIPEVPVALTLCSTPRPSPLGSLGAHRSLFL